MTAWTKTRAGLRSDTVARAVALCVDTRRGVLVVGPPGAGASQCAADIAAGLRAAGVPVVVWDDLDRLPPGATVRPVPDGGILVASARIGATLPAGIERELRTRTTRLPLRNLTRGESEVLVEAAVGMPLAARLVEALWSCSHGNVAALRATFSDLAASGLLRPTRDRMALTVDPVTAAGGVTVDPRLWLDDDNDGDHNDDDDNDGDQAILTTAALARRISLRGLVAWSGDDAVSSLVARGLLVAGEVEGVEVLTVQPPVLASALRAGAGLRRRAQVYEAVLGGAGSGALDSWAPAGSGVLAAAPDPSIVLWALANGGGGDGLVVVDARRVSTTSSRGGGARPVDAVAVLTAARAALDAHDYRTGVEIYQAARRAGVAMTFVQQAELALVAGSSLRLLERLPEAASVLEQALEHLQEGEAGGVGAGRGESSGLLIQIVMARADLAHYRDRGPETALQMIDAARGMLAPDHAGQLMLDALTVVHLTYSGRHREAARAYTALAELESPPPAEWQRRLEANHALSLDMLGQPEAALSILRRLARRARTMVHHAWASEEYLSALFAVVLHGFGVVVLEGEWAPFHAAEHDDAVRIDHGMRRVAQAEIDLSAGDLPAAVSAAADAVDTVEVDGPEDFLPRALSQYALALAMSGQAASAREQLVALRAVPAYTNSPVGPEIRAGEAGVLFCLGRSDEARVLLRVLVDDGLHGAAVRGALVGVMMADAETCRGVAELAVTGDIPVLVQDLAAAVLAENPRRLLEVARRARGYGSQLVAWAAADRARALAAPGSDLCLLAERLLATSDVHGSHVFGASGPSGSVPPGVSLTRRESEIADLVGRGLANAEIATELHLSKRTVEGHLNRIYTKTGARLRG